MKRTITHEHHEHQYKTYNWGIDKIIIAFFSMMLILTTFSSVMDWTAHTIKYNEDIYEECVDACSKAHWAGFQEEGMSKHIVEFDRTNCIYNCNEFYLSLVMNETG